MQNYSSKSKIFRRIIIAILGWEAKCILVKYKPEIIAVAGSVGKTSAKDAIFEILQAKGSVRKSEKSYNSEIGLPLTIIGRENAWYSLFGWLSIIAAGIARMLFRKKDYPAILVVEVGADRPGDIARAMRLIHPRIAVMTAIGEVPVHVEFFSGPEALAREKEKLFSGLRGKDVAILHFDDAVVSDMKEKMKCQVLTYGFGEGADIRAEHYHVMFRDGALEHEKIPEGIAFKIEYEGNNIPVRIFGAFGKQQVYAGLAAIAAGIAYGMNALEAVSALARYTPPPGRLKLIPGEKKTWILDDSYNASPHATHAALEVLEEIPALRKIAVLGDMLELGKFTEQAHRAVAERLKGVDVLVTVGLRAKFIADEARAHGFNPDSIFEFDISQDAAKKLEEIIEKGDLILVKGSQSIRMERVVEAIMAEPEKAGELLVRQDKVWKQKV